MGSLTRGCCVLGLRRGPGPGTAPRGGTRPPHHLPVPTPAPAGSGRAGSAQLIKAELGNEGRFYQAPAVREGRDGAKARIIGKGLLCFRKKKRL